jgi:hypothetical protein
VTYPQDKHDQHVMKDVVNEPVISDSNPIDVLFAFELSSGRRQWILGESFDCPGDSDSQGKSRLGESACGRC